MSTSSSAAARARECPAPGTEPFPYVEVDGQAGDGESGAAERQKRQQAEAFEQGRQEGLRLARAELSSAIEGGQDRIARAVGEFAGEREQYYRRVEREVVQLALAIARKILHREAQLDPQALTGIVRVTLEKLDAGTQVTVHVHPKEAAEWRHYFACQTDGAPAPEVREDPALGAGECRIETSMGTTEVGLETQLKEIETGLLDLLAERPGK